MKTILHEVVESQLKDFFVEKEMSKKQGYGLGDSFFDEAGLDYIMINGSLIFITQIFNVLAFASGILFSN